MPAPGTPRLGLLRSGQHGHGCCLPFHDVVTHVWCPESRRMRAKGFHWRHATWLFQSETAVSDRKGNPSRRIHTSASPPNGCMRADQVMLPDMAVLQALVCTSASRAIRKQLRAWSWCRGACFLRIHDGLSARGVHRFALRGPVLRLWYVTGSPCTWSASHSLARSSPRLLGSVPLSSVCSLLNAEVKRLWASLLTRLAR